MGNSYIKNLYKAQEENVENSVVGYEYFTAFSPHLLFVEVMKWKCIIH